MAVLETLKITMVAIQITPDYNYAPLFLIGRNARGSVGLFVHPQPSITVFQSSASVETGR